MRIVCISDTHNKLNKIKIPDGDVLIHAGDATSRGYTHELEDFNKKMGRLPHTTKIFIPGNHDLLCEEPETAEIFTDITHYLVDEAVVIDSIKFYGSPWQPRFGTWAFNLFRGIQLRQKWAEIPDDTNVLITHGPPYGILDETQWNGPQGCEELISRISQLEHLRLHVFGHIHEAYGQKTINGVTYCNVSSCTLQYEPVNKPMVFDL